MKDELHNYSGKTDSADNNTELPKTVENDFQKKIRDSIIANMNRLPPFKPKPQRIVDKYTREEISRKLDHFASHSAARGVDPTMHVILDWLYSEKEFNEKDDFVTIERLIEMLKTGKATPLLMHEVLEYALAVEKAAIEVYKDLHFLSDELDSMNNLREALDLRLETETDKKNDDIMPSILKNAFGKSNSNKKN